MAQQEEPLYDFPEPAQPSARRRLPCQRGRGSLRSISVLDRLRLTVSVWLQLSINPATALHILQREPPGTFLVRKSRTSRRNVLCVRLADDSVPSFVQQFGIREELSTVTLETSAISFPDLPRLVSFYCVSRDVLPFPLELPEAIAKATSHKELESISHMGVEFWSSHLNVRGPRDAAMLQTEKKPEAASSAPPTAPPPPPPPPPPPQTDSDQPLTSAPGAAPGAATLFHEFCPIATRSPRELDCGSGLGALCFINPLFLQSQTALCRRRMFKRSLKVRVSMETSTMLSPPLAPPPPPPLMPKTKKRCKGRGVAQQPIGAMQTAQQPIGAMQTAQQPIGAMQTAQRPIGAMQTAQQPIGATQTAQQPIGATQTAQQPIGAMQTDQQPIGAMQTAQRPIGAMQTAQRPIGEMQTAQQPIGAMQTAQQPIGAMQTVPEESDYMQPTPVTNFSLSPYLSPSLSLLPHISPSLSPHDSPALSPSLSPYQSPSPSPKAPLSLSPFTSSPSSQLPEEVHHSPAPVAPPSRPDQQRPERDAEGTDGNKDGDEEEEEEQQQEHQEEQQEEQQEEEQEHQEEQHQEEQQEEQEEEQQHQEQQQQQEEHQEEQQEESLVLQMVAASLKDSDDCSSLSSLEEAAETQEMTSSDL